MSPGLAACLQGKLGAARMSVWNGASLDFFLLARILCQLKTSEVSSDALLAKPSLQTFEVWDWLGSYARLFDGMGAVSADFS